MGGLNASQPLPLIPPTDALALENFIIRPFGLEIRKGWKYWHTTAFPAQVRTIMPYVGAITANRRLFASTAEAGVGKRGPLYDITTPGGPAPTVPALIPSTEPTYPGEWFFTMFSTAGGSWLACVQEGAGYYVYGPWEGAALPRTWKEIATGGAGPAGQKVNFPASDTTTTKDFCFITTWKNRIWFIARNSSKAYYLEANSLSGDLKLFDFGALFNHGGNLQLIANWTYDGGRGMDDNLVILNDQGDMLIYEGTDPASTSTFALKGQWFVGEMPIGRRNYAQQGGDLWLATEYGVISVSDMVSGRVTAPTSQSTAAGKFNPWLARNISGTKAQRYWFLCPYPAEELLILGTPFINPTYGYRVSYTMSAITKGWAAMTNVDPLCAEIFNSQFIFADRDGWVKLGFSGFRDGDSYDSATQGTEVTAKFQAGFSDYGSPNQNKRATRVRLLGISDLTPSYRMKVVSEYDLAITLSTPSPLRPIGSLWDIAKWDEAYWQLAQQTFRKWFGIASFGKLLSLQLAIRGGGYTVVTDYEITYQEGIGL